MSGRNFGWRDKANLFGDQMPQATAYSEEHDRNITLDEAYKYFFAQEVGKRERFTFRCGDPRCRAQLKPLVVAALYDREDLPGKKLRSPYFRAHKAHPHILTCTWVSEMEARPNAASNNQVAANPSSSALAELGLVFKLKKPKTGANKPSPMSDQPSEGTDVELSEKPEGKGQKDNRPETSKFMATVAGRYLSYSDQQRKSIELSIEKKYKGTFYDACMPIVGFHPHFQAERIYHGRVKIFELNNVFLIKFVLKMDPDGKRDNRTTAPEIKLLKKWLAENDLALNDLLHEIAQSHSLAWCFFYTETPPSLVSINDVPVARFEVENAAHLAVIIEREIETEQPDAGE